MYFDVSSGHALRTNDVANPLLRTPLRLSLRGALPQPVVHHPDNPGLSCDSKHSRLASRPGAELT